MRLNAGAQTSFDPFNESFRPPEGYEKVDAGEFVARNVGFDSFRPQHDSIHLPEHTCLLEKLRFCVEVSCPEARHTSFSYEQTAFFEQRQILAYHARASAEVRRQEQ